MLPQTLFINIIIIVIVIIIIVVVVVVIIIIIVNIISIYLPLSTKFPIYQFFVCFFIVIYQFVFCEYFSWLVFTHLWIFTLVFTKHQALVFFKIVHGDQLVELKAEKKICCCFVPSKAILIWGLKVFILSLWLTINIRF